MSKKTTSRMLMDESPLTVSPSLAASIGINEAIMLQQIHYWLKIAEKDKNQSKFKRGRWWTYNTYEQWIEQFPWMSVTTVRRVVKKLKDMKLIATVKHGSQGKDQTLWYTINYEGVDDLREPIPAEDEGSEDSESDEQLDVSILDNSTEGSMCPDWTDHVSRLDSSYATETYAKTSSEDSLRSSSGESDKSPVPGFGKDESSKAEKPIAERSVTERQSYYIGYLADRLGERELLGSQPLTGAYKGRLAGELRNHMNAGMKHAAILLVLDKIVFRWPERRLDFYAAADDTDELSRRRESRSGGRTTADREYDEAFREAWDGYASDFADPDNPGLPLMNPDLLAVGERCFHRGQRYRCDEEGVVWAGRARADYVEPRRVV